MTKPALTYFLLLSTRSEEHTSELHSPCNLVCRLLLEKKRPNRSPPTTRSAGWPCPAGTAHRRARSVASWAAVAPAARRCRARSYCVFFFFFLMIRRPPRSTLFPYTTALPI